MSEFKFRRPIDICFSEDDKPRPARTAPAEVWSADEEPWPWCPYRDRPHDAHVVNEGNTRCAGRSGELPPMEAERAAEMAAYWGERADDARDTITSATARWDAANKAVLRYARIHTAATKGS